LNDIPVLGQDDDRLLKQLLGHYDVPAYVRRARRVQEALDELVGFCRTKREELLGMVRIRIGILHALTGTWTGLRCWLADEEQCRVLEELHRLLGPKLRVSIEPTTAPRRLRRALREMRESLQRFNRRWREFLGQIDLRPVNEARENYNRYYVLEKECAVRSAVLARRGFHLLEPFTLEQLAALVPELPVPQLAD
jgi:hypothetical protein